MVYDLQSRWKAERGYLRYYGLRAKPHMFQNKIRITRAQKSIIDRLPCELSDEDLRSVKNLLGAQIVPAEQKRAVPQSLTQARFCKGCVANDFMIPGIEFDADGLCPMCATKQETAELRSLVPIMNTFPRAKRSRFDVAVFYTGGKDSTYLLYELAKKQGLRVLALTWEIPFMSESARRSIEGAKRSLEGVEFMTRKVSDSDLRTVYKALYARSGNVCACPSLAYVLFYPELVANRVPYFIVGNEPAQILGLYYNHMAPKPAYSFAGNWLLNGLINVGRVLTLHPPLKRGQFHTLSTMRQLAYGTNPLVKLSGYRNVLVENVIAAIHEVPMLVKPLKRALRASSWSGHIPAFVQVDLNEICGGRYDWRDIVGVIERECGWVAPSSTQKGLHTSCSIERCKEYTQFLRFYNMQSDMIPFSALEIALASRDGSVSREAAVRELENEIGFSLCEIDECAIMKAYLEEEGKEAKEHMVV